jgi:hypothetical protein
VNGESTKGAGYSMDGVLDSGSEAFAQGTRINFGGPYDADSFSCWNICFNQDDINEIYNSGKPLPAVDHSKFSSSNCFLAFGGEDALDDIDIASLATDIDCIQDQSGNDNHISAYYYWGYQPSLQDHSTSSTDVAAGTSLYVATDIPATTTSAPVIFRNGGKTGTAPNEVFSEGITVSISDKYADSTGVYVSAGAQDPKLVISFDGFEDDADKVLVYDNDVTDNTWKNIVVTYDSSATDDKDRISLYVNNVEQTPLGTPSITFTGNNNYFKNVSDTATNTTIGGSGFDAASANSIYALQAEIDSISLHSEALSSAMVTELYDSGVPANLLDDSLTSDHTKIETWVSFEDETDDGTTAQDRTDNNKDMTLVNMASGDYVTLTVLDSIYYNP